MGESDAATAGEQQEQWVTDLLADRANLRKDSAELLQSLGRHVKRAEAAEAELATLRAENARLRDVANDLVRQVDEFHNWDAKDWPAAFASLQALASAARRALEEG